MIDSAAQPPLRPEIDVSWRRSVVSGLAPDQMPDFTVDEDLGNREALLRAARPVFDVAATELADSDTALILTDNDSRIITLSYGGVQVERNLATIGAVRGSMMGEDVIGTTALGTPVETRSSLTVNGTEHYLEIYKHLSCFGRPIVHPTTHRLEGILCMTAVSEQTHPLFAPMVNRLVADIQARLLDAAQSSHRLVLNAFHAVAHRRGVAVVAIGDDLLLTNTTASNLLDSADIGALRAITSDPSGLIPASMMMMLSSGLIVSISGERINGAHAAAVFVVAPAAAKRDPIPRGAGLSAELFPSNDFQVVAAGSARSLAVLGEPGSGRSAQASDAVGDAAAYRIDVSGRIAAGGEIQVAAAVSTAAASDGVLVVDGAELLGDNDIALLRRVITERRVPVVLTGPPVAELRPAVASVVAMCDEQIATTPLRNQPHRIATLAQHFLTRHADKAKLGAGVVDALAAHEWPANLTELDRVIAAAVDSASSRGSRLLEVSDLPARYRTSSRSASLTVLERMERQGIVDALGECRGNKAHAAKLLGISRSTLYVRLKALGIEPPG
ncbi:Fis family transcriptional regulator [Gordonia sp. TBRC 11910]|uniref:Fis family transcriptional regulator n=1 Tax=Gordonia asplenii TaxID=2725283 RepID=A0A848KW33_9ACTN|nr:helix-turn-helix domain-containing protein [Gordonia asplenii]NMO02876.1 Fis family transcriptional regulator [Gordonia asplenii]